MYFDSIENCQNSIDIFGSQMAIPMIVRMMFDSEHTEYSATETDYLITAMTNTLVESAIIIKQKLEDNETQKGDNAETLGHEIMYKKWDIILNKNPI